jgi:hypothetical protein
VFFARDPWAGTECFSYRRHSEDRVDEQRGAVRLLSGHELFDKVLLVEDATRGVVPRKIHRDEVGDYGVFGGDARPSAGADFVKLMVDEAMSSR